jgi:hypothetical protein
MGIKLAILAVILLALAVAVFGLYSVYQHHLSVEVRNAVSGATKNDVSMAQFEEYLHDARMAARTKRDAEVVGAMDAVEDTSKAHTEAEATLQAERNLVETDIQLTHTLCQVPPVVKADCEEAGKASQSAIDEEKPLEANIDATAKEFADARMKLYAVVGLAFPPGACADYAESFQTAYPGCPTVQSKH